MNFLRRICNHFFGKPMAVPRHFAVDFPFDSRDPREQLSDVPDQWREAIVTARTLETGIADCADGSRVGFSAGNLLRNRTHFENTQVGAKVWITERGGISAYPPDPRSPQQRYDDMMTAHVSAVI